MGYPIDRRFGLVLQFAEFTLLPDLLARVPESPGTETPDAWRGLLLETGYNTDHVADEDVDDSPEEMAADAWRLALGLELVTKDGLTTSGGQLAELILAEEPPPYRTVQQVLRRMLAQQIDACYFGPESSLPQLLQAGAQRLAESERGDYFPGLLLAEIQSLIQWAHTEGGSTDQPLARLIEARKTAEETYGIPEVDLTGISEIMGEAEAGWFAGRIGLADAITRYYLDTHDMDGMTVTEVRSTAMLLTISGFLEERFLVGPVQCLGISSER